MAARCFKFLLIHDNIGSNGLPSFSDLTQQYQSLSMDLKKLRDHNAVSNTTHVRAFQTKDEEQIIPKSTLHPGTTRGITMQLSS